MCMIILDCKFVLLYYFGLFMVVLLHCISVSTVFAMPKKKNKQKVDLNSSSSEDEWEDVAETQPSAVVDNDVQIQLDLPDVSKHSSKIEQAKEWIATLIKRAINKSEKEIQIRMHKTHLLGLLCIGMRLNQICLNEELQCRALSLVETSYAKIQSSEETKQRLEKLLSHISTKVSFNPQLDAVGAYNIMASSIRLRAIMAVFETGVAKSFIDLILIYVIFLRSLGFNCRLVMSFQPIPLKPLTEKQKQAKSKKVELELKKAKAKVERSKTLQIPQLDGAADGVVLSRRSNRIHDNAIASSAASTSFPTSDVSSTEKNETRNESRRKKNKRPNSEITSKDDVSDNENSNSATTENAPPAKKLGAMASSSKKSGKSQRCKKSAEEKWLDRLTTDVGLLNSDCIPKNIPGKSSTKQLKGSKKKTSKKNKTKSASNDGNLEYLNNQKFSEKSSVTVKSVSSQQQQSHVEKSQRRSRNKQINYAEKSDDDFTSGNECEANDDKDKVSESNRSTLAATICPARKLSTLVNQSKKEVKRQSRKKPLKEIYLDQEKISERKSSQKRTSDTPSDDNTKSSKKLKPNEMNSSEGVSSSPLLTAEKGNKQLKGSQRRARTGRKNYAEKRVGQSSTSDDDDNSDADFDFDREVFGKKDIKVKTTKKAKKTINMKTTTQQALKSSHTTNQWIEVYVEDVGWMAVNCLTGLVVDPKVVEQNARKPVHYVIAFDGQECIKDVTVRYASDWLISTRKLRVNSVDQQWWKNTLNPFKTTNQDLDEEENEELEMNLLSQPLPTSISAYKNHPLFALRRHLLKYEAIYPPDVPSLGFIRGEEVLPRSSVHVLHTREKWLQSALSVKAGSTPYKMVASYLLNKKLNRDSDVPSLALFGKWQTEPYQPPIAENGKVPRNEYGNVDLFQPSMLPVGCVQLRLPSLNLIARKLNIDVATAIVGFDTHHGYPHPVTDGYIVCKEHETVLREAWEQEQAHAEEKAREKLEKRVYSNWKALIRGLLALQKVRQKYSDKAKEGVGFSNNEVVSSTAWQAQKLKEAKDKFESRGRRRKKKSLE